MRGMETMQVLVIKLGEFFLAIGIILYAGGNALVRRINHNKYFVRIEVPRSHYAGDMRFLHIIEPFIINSLFNNQCFVVYDHDAKVRNFIGCHPVRWLTDRDLISKVAGRM